MRFALAEHAVGVRNHTDSDANRMLGTDGPRDQTAILALAHDEKRSTTHTSTSTMRM